MTLVQWLRSRATDAVGVRWHAAFGIAWALLAFAQSFTMPAGGLFVGAYGALAIAHLALALRQWRVQLKRRRAQTSLSDGFGPSTVPRLGRCLRVVRALPEPRASRGWNTP